MRCLSKPTDESRLIHHSSDLAINVSSRRGYVFITFPPAADGDYVKEWHANSDPIYANNCEVFLTDDQLPLGYDILGVININLTLPAAEGRYKLDQFICISCDRPLDPPALRFLVGIRNSRPGCLYLLIRK